MPYRQGTVFHVQDHARSSEIPFTARAFPLVIGCVGNLSGEAWRKTQTEC